MKKIRLREENHTGNIKSVNGYSLTGRVDRSVWNKIKHLMVFEDMRCNDSIWHGERFVGWIVKKGCEAEVEEILGVAPENRIAAEQNKEDQKDDLKDQISSLQKTINAKFEESGTYVQQIKPTGEIEYVKAGYLEWYILGSDDGKIWRQYENHNGSWIVFSQEIFDKITELDGLNKKLSALYA